MKVLWTVLKVAVVAALAIPLSIIVLSLALGVLGALFGLAVFVLRFAVIGLAIWGVFKLVAWMLRKEPASPAAPAVRALPPVDPHYEAAMRELDSELRSTR